MSNRRTVGIVYNPTIQGAKDLVTELAERLGLKEGALVCSVDELERMDHDQLDIDLLITVGGDGTILRAVRIAAPHEVPILGINMGHMGFMTELRAEDAVDNLDRYLANDLWVEERAMLQAEVVEFDGATSDKVWHALNEVVVGSNAVARMARIQVSIDETLVATYRADSVIVATATGSTGYALSAGGPILHPQSKDILLKPVAAHLGLTSALVLPASSLVELTVLSDAPAMLSVDGHSDVHLSEGARVRVQASQYVARFLRANAPSYHYALLMRRLGLGPGDGSPRAIV
ncbi:MAG: NAD(+)/NADH kinase [Chloroflexi bacterium]|nr:NAD(+)/NADH kinase [Chloroflexota bacterium]